MGHFMRDSIIKSLNFLVWLLGAIIFLAGLISGVAIMSLPQGGFLQGLMVIIGAAIYAILTLGFYFIAVGIYDHTKRTADATERMANR